MSALQQKYLELLKNELVLMDRAAAVLENTWHGFQQLQPKDIYSLAEMDQLELLAIRFSRLIDFIIQRIFRLIDELDLEVPGTVLDRINRAEKKV